MAITTPWRASFNGVTWGVGTDIQLDTPGYAGLRSLPDIRGTDQPNARRDGSTPGLNVLAERIFTANLLVSPPFPSGLPFETVIATLANALQNISNPSNQLPLELLLPGWANSRIITCRPTKALNDITLRSSQFYAEIPLEFTASDPLIYSSIQQTASAGLPSPTAGLTFNATPNFIFGASSGGSMVVSNAGNYVTAPVFTITGPCTNPAVTFTSTGMFMKLNLTLGPGDVVVIDMKNRTVVLNGTSYRFNTVVTGSSWWGIPPGTWSIGVSSSDSSAVAAVFAVAWRDAWGFM